MGKSEITTKYIGALGCDHGFVLGIYFIVMFVLMAYSLESATLGVVSVVMALAVPVVTFFFMRRFNRLTNRMASLSALWLHGILMFICGSIMLGGFVLVYLRWFDPDFIGRALKTGIEFYSQDKSTADIADQLQLILDSNMMPSSVSIAISWMWSGCFSGSLLSLVVAAVVRAVSGRAVPPRIDNDLKQQ